MRAGDEIVLVGAGEHGVTPIRTYTEAEARSLGLIDARRRGLGRWTRSSPRCSARRPAAGRFVDELRKRTVIK